MNLHLEWLYFRSGRGPSRYNQWKLTRSDESDEVRSCILIRRKTRSKIGIYRFEVAPRGAASTNDLLRAPTRLPDL